MVEELSEETEPRSDGEGVIGALSEPVLELLAAGEDAIIGAGETEFSSLPVEAKARGMGETEFSSLLVEDGATTGRAETIVGSLLTDAGGAGDTELCPLPVSTSVDCLDKQEHFVLLYSVFYPGALGLLQFEIFDLALDHVPCLDQRWDDQGGLAEKQQEQLEEKWTEK
nr:hypothetical protein Iba_chr07bCG8920 [Ipomoea batatas]GMD17785.1 hypothetical protein Iba_chr07dCG6930 [Ipomoea batatas]GMD20616.1 hypothetical protein Iba_chr07fCG6530 [Ipomoea batatas]